MDRLDSAIAGCSLQLRREIKLQIAEIDNTIALLDPAVKKRKSIDSTLPLMTRTLKQAP